MKSPGIETYHTKIEKSIRLVTSYSDIKELPFIIRACRLKPYDHLFGKGSRKLKLHRWWIDEFGNSLQLIKKNVVIKYNDLKLDRHRITCTDMYYGLSLDKIAKISKLIHFCAGKDEDLYQDCYLITFLGIDNHLRSYLYWYGEWQQVSPLLLGMHHLQLIANSEHILYFKQLEKTKNNLLPCISEEGWLSLLPPSGAFLDILKRQYETIYHILGYLNEDTRIADI